MGEPLKVVVWSTGTIGRHAIAGIDAHPALELVAESKQHFNKCMCERAGRWLLFRYKGELIMLTKYKQGPVASSHTNV